MHGGVSDLLRARRIVSGAEGGVACPPQKLDPSRV
jgi:hypothetical protein